MAVLADKNQDIFVDVVDVSVERLEAWNCREFEKLPVYEKGLEEILRRTRNVNLFFTTDIASSIKKADIVFIAVNTPTKSEGFGAGY